MGMKKHSRQCACDRKAYEEEQKYFKDKEHRELVSRNTSICFDESRMEEWTFENADMSDAVMHKAKNYVDNLAIRLSNIMGRNLNQANPVLEADTKTLQIRRCIPVHLLL